MSPRASSHIRPRGLLHRWILPIGLVVSACATGGAPGAAGEGPATAPDAGAATAEAASRDYAAADVAFMRGMIRHHAQATVMARLAPTHGASPPLRRLAARILNSQKTEIALMADWLRDRGEPVPDVAAPAVRDSAAVPLDGWDDGPQMPGLLSDAKLARLDAARGEAFDRLFLEYMIEHHRGAVVMVDRLVQQPDAARQESVFRLAAGIRADQSSEIDRMRRMLEDRLLEAGRRR